MSRGAEGMTVGVDKAEGSPAANRRQPSVVARTTFAFHRNPTIRLRGKQWQLRTVKPITCTVGCTKYLPINHALVHEFDTRPMPCGCRSRSRHIFTMPQYMLLAERVINCFTISFEISDSEYNFERIAGCRSTTISNTVIIKVSSDICVYLSKNLKRMSF